MIDDDEICAVWGSAEDLKYSVRCQLFMLALVFMLLLTDQLKGHEWLRLARSVAVDASDDRCVSKSIAWGNIEGSINRPSSRKTKEKAVIFN